MLVLPVLVIVSESVPLLPTFTLPKLKLVGFALRAPAATPVPVSDIVNVGFGAFEVTVKVPLSLPLEVGAKVTVKVVLLDAASVSGVMIPLTENPLPLTETCETDTLVESLFVSVITWDFVAPMVTLPNDSVVGFSCSSPVPSPESETVALGV